MPQLFGLLLWLFATAPLYAASCIGSLYELAIVDVFALQKKKTLTLKELHSLYPPSIKIESDSKGVTLTEGGWDVSANVSADTQGHRALGFNFSLTLPVVSGGPRSSILRGSREFQHLLKYFAGQFDYIAGHWEPWSDNYTQYFKAAQVTDDTDTAVLSTWTGRQARRFGFTLIRNFEQDEDGAIDVEFWPSPAVDASLLQSQN